MSECHGTKSLSKGIMIVFKTKGLQIRCIRHVSLGLSQCKSSCKKHAGKQNLSKDINNTLYANTLYPGEVRTGSMKIDLQRPRWF